MLVFPSRRHSFALLGKLSNRSVLERRMVSKTAFALRIRRDTTHSLPISFRILSAFDEAGEFPKAELLLFSRISSSATCLCSVRTNDSAFSLVQCMPGPVNPVRAVLWRVSSFCSSSSSCDRISALVRLSTAMARKTFSRVSLNGSQGEH